MQTADLIFVSISSLMVDVTDQCL